MSNSASATSVAAFSMIVRQISNDFLHTDLKPDVEAGIAVNLTNHVKYAVQEALKFKLLGKSQRLTGEHINQALEKLFHDKVYNVKKSIEFRSSSSSSKRRGSCNLVSLVDVDLHNFVRIPLPRCPVSPGITYHWLAVRSRQPRIPENPILLVNSHQSFNLVSTNIIQPVAGLNTALIHNGVESRPLLEHIIPLELQTYLDKLIVMLEQTSDEGQVSRALNSLSADIGLQPIIPHFVHYLYSRVKSNLMRTGVLKSCLNATSHLLLNQNVKLDLYLHQILPTVLSCVITNRLVVSGAVEGDEQMTVRHAAARVLETIVTKFSIEYPDLLPRVMKAYVSALSDPSSSIASVIGSLYGLQLLGDKSLIVVCNHLTAVMRRAIDVTDDDDNVNEKSALIARLVSRILSSLFLICMFQAKLGHKLSSLKSEKVKRVLEEGSSELGEEFVPYFTILSNSTYVRLIV